MKEETSPPRSALPLTKVAEALPGGERRWRAGRHGTIGSPKIREEARRIDLNVIPSQPLKAGRGKRTTCRPGGTDRKPRARMDANQPLRTEPFQFVSVERDRWRHLPGRTIPQQRTCVITARRRSRRPSETLRQAMTDPCVFTGSPRTAPRRKVPQAICE